MNRATPLQMRKCLEAVDVLKKAGIRFVPIPVFDDSDNDLMAEQMVLRLNAMETIINLPKKGEIG